jgi:hypothetical protein
LSLCRCLVGFAWSEEAAAPTNETGLLSPPSSLWQPGEVLSPSLLRCQLPPHMQSPSVAQGAPGSTSYSPTSAVDSTVFIEDLVSARLPVYVTWSASRPSLLVAGQPIPYAWFPVNAGGTYGSVRAVGLPHSRQTTPPALPTISVARLLPSVIYVDVTTGGIEE